MPNIGTKLYCHFLRVFCFSFKQWSHGNSCGGLTGFYGGRGGNGFHGGGHTGGHGEKKCAHCGGTNHTEPYCWVKYGKPDYMNQVADGTGQPQPTSTLFGHATSNSG